MALIKCPECGKEISDKAGECPNCGYPLEDMRVEKEEVAEEISVEAVDNDISKEVVEEKTSRKRNQFLRK